MLRRHAPLDARQRQRCHDANNTYTSTLLHNDYMVEKIAARDTYRHQYTRYGVEEK